MISYAGESVTYQARLRASDLATVMRLEQLDTSSPEAVQDGMTQLRDFLKTRISATDWTSDAGEVYESVDAMLEDADLDEIRWLLANVVPERSEAAKGEASTPST
jgi:hypothetical protein